MSDRPAEKSKVEFLELCHPPTPPPPLTWRDILRDDPVEDTALWEDVKFADGSSDDDLLVASETESIDDSSQPSPPTSVANYDDATAESFLLAVDESELDQLERDQEWRVDRPEGANVEEIHVVREIVHLMLGLPTTIFQTQEKSQSGGVDFLPSLLQCSGPSTINLLDEMAQTARSVSILRSFASRDQDEPLLQRFTASCETALREFDFDVSAIEQRYVSISKPQVISTMSVVHDLQALAAPLVALQDLIQQNWHQVEQGSFLLLDALFQQALDAEIIGQRSIFKLLGTCLIESLEVYLRPLQQWMQSGEVPRNASHFCVSKRQDDCPLENFWHDMFQLNLRHDRVAAPAFMQEHMTDVLDSGKSMAMIRAMGFPLPIPHKDASSPQSTLPLKEALDDESSLLPFSTHLHIWLSTWQRSIRQPTWTPLRAHLLTSLALPATLQALETIYLSRDGSRFIGFVDALSARLDAAPYSWKDQVYTEELARATFGTHPAVDPRRLSVSFATATSKNPLLNRSVHALASLSVVYSFPWPLANIIPPEAQQTYQSAQLLLLQLRRAIRALSAHRGRGAGAQAHASPVPPALRHTLLHALSTLHHAAAHALHAASRTVHARLVTADSVPALQRAHADFLSAVRRATLLPPSMRIARDALVSLCDVAVLLGEAGAADDSGGVSLGRKRGERMKGLRGQVGQLRSVVVGELRRDGGEEYMALAEALEGGVAAVGRRGRRAELS